MKSAITQRHWNQIICSPLQRCQDFAHYASQRNNTALKIDTNWQEIFFGAWEGKTYKQIQQSFPDTLTRFYQDPLNNTPEQGEQLSDFICRINLAWETLIHQHQGNHVLVITHAGVIRCLFSLLLKLPVENTFRLQIDHASFTRFQCFHDKSENFVKLIFHNLSHPNLYSSVTKE